MLAIAVSLGYRSKLPGEGAKEGVETSITDRRKQKGNQHQSRVKPTKGFTPPRKALFISCGGPVVFLLLHPHTLKRGLPVFRPYLLKQKPQ